MQQANLVLGQTSFFGQSIKDLSRQTMPSAFGLALTAAGQLVVSDALSNRVLFFSRNRLEEISSPGGRRRMCSGKRILSHRRRRFLAFPF